MIHEHETNKLSKAAPLISNILGPLDFLNEAPGPPASP
jgi:hypothetical protein